MKALYNHSSNKSGIYIIYCTTNFGVYVGSTSLFKNRRTTHLYGLRNNQHHCRYLQNAWNKYGEDAFVFQVVELTTKEERFNVEQKYLNLHFGKKYCYNARPQANNAGPSDKSKEELKNTYSRVKSESERKKISDSLKKNPVCWKKRNYTDSRIIYAVDTLLDEGLFPRGMKFEPSETELLTKEAKIAYTSFPYYCANNPEKTAERMQRKRDFKTWLEYQGIWIDKRKDSWNRKSTEDKEAALRILQDGRLGI